MNKTTWIIIFVFIIIVIVLVLLKAFGKKCKESDTAFECIEKRGAEKSSTFPGSLEYESIDPTRNIGVVYRFFSNNRVANLETGSRGNYDKEKISWDGGQYSITLDELFST